MKKASLAAVPVVIFIVAVVILRFSPVDRSLSLLLATLGLPIAALIAYFVSGKRDVKSALLGLALAIPLGVVSMLAVYQIRSGTLFIPDITMTHLAGVMGLALTAALAEEFLFRGVILGLLTKYFSKAPVSGLLAIQALLFAVSHFHKSPLFYIQAFIAGLFFGWTVLKTRSLWFAIGFHFGWDMVIVFATGYHSQNLGHIKGMLVLEPGYAQVENVVFVLAVAMAAWVFRRWLPAFRTPPQTHRGPHAG